MQLQVGFEGLKLATTDLAGDIATDATEAMREVTPVAKQWLREQVTAAGLGSRLANTWRSDVYPRSRRSVNPSGYIWSNAPDIIDSFSRGATIVPLAGRRFLAIPTDAVPRARGRRGSSRRMTPEQVENAFNADLFFKRGRNGRVLAFINVVRARRGRGFRQATKGRVAQGRELEQVLMFVLVPTARLPKLLDLNAVGERWAAAFDAAFTRRLAAR